MADNLLVSQGTGTTIAADDIGAGVLAQRVKVVWGPDGTGNDTDTASGHPMPIQIRGSDGTDYSTIGQYLFAQATATSGSTGYVATDVIGGALDFNLGAISGRSILITSVSMQIDQAAIIAGQTSNHLHFFNVTPPSAIADSTNFDLPSGDRTSYLGPISLPTPIDQGATMYIKVDGINAQFKLSGTHIFAYLVADGTYTPTVQSYLVTLHAIQL